MPRQYQFNFPNPNKCLYCDRPASRWCDYILGWKPTELYVVRHPTISPDAEAYTCDAPLCEVHAVKGKTTFFCGRGGCEVETEDYCPSHPHQNTDTGPIFPWDANRERMAERLKVELKIDRRRRSRWLE